MVVFALILLYLLVRIHSKTSDELICNPSNAGKVQEFLQQQWNHARTLLKLNPLSFNSNDGINNEGLNEFYRFHSGANEGIVFNLDEYSKSIGAKKYQTKLTLRSNTSVEEFKYHLRQQNISHYHTFTPRPLDFTRDDIKYDFLTFTFVRDPMARFESGLAEAAWKTHEAVSKSSRKRQFKISSMDQVKRYLLELLNFKPSSLRHINHVYTQSGTFFQYNVEILGHLESFRQDWTDKIVPLYNITTYEYDDKLGKHASAISHPHGASPVSERLGPPGDPNYLRKYYHLLLSTEPIYVHVICHMILIDYVCLPEYNLPPNCQFLNKTREHMIRIMKQR